MIAIELVSPDGSVVEKKLYPTQERLTATRWMDDFLDAHLGLVAMWAEDENEDASEEVSTLESHAHDAHTA